MEIEYKGANCVTIKTKQASLVVDPKLSTFGLKDQISKVTAQLATLPEFAVDNSEVLKIDGPGEYEVSGISIVGVPARAHIDTAEEGQRTTMYRVDSGDVSVAIVGHTLAPLTEEQLETLGLIDIVIVPIGGGGYTLDAHEAVQIIRQINPKLVVPTHYADDGIKYEVPQADLEAFQKELGSNAEEMPKLKIKGSVTQEALALIKLQRTA